MLAGREGRGRHVEDDSGAGGGELVDRIVMVTPPLPEVAIVPDVLADADPNARTGDVEQLRAVIRLEIAVFVEDVVGRQQRLAETVLDAAAAQQHRAVEERTPFIGRVRLGQTDQHRRKSGRVPREGVNRVPAAAHEARAEEQVARQVADQRELGRGGQIGVGGRGDLQRLENQSCVAGEIADRGVDLQQRDFHEWPAHAGARPGRASIVVRSFVTGPSDRTTR